MDSQGGNIAYDGNEVTFGKEEPDKVPESPEVVDRVTESKDKEPEKVPVCAEVTSEIEKKDEYSALVDTEEPEKPPVIEDASINDFTGAEKEAKIMVKLYSEEVDFLKGVARPVVLDRLENSVCGDYLDVDFRGSQSTLFFDRLSAIEISALTNVLCHSDCLRRLDLSYNQITDELISNVVSFLNKSICIKALVLRGNNITDRGCYSLCNSVGIHPSLESLDINGNPLTGAGVIVFAKMFQKFSSPTLTELDIGNTHCNLRGLMGLLTALRSDHRLRSLNVENPRLGGPEHDELALHIWKTSLASPFLEKLNISKCSLGDSGLECVVNYLQGAAVRHCKLTDLSLIGNRIARPGGVSVAEFLRSAPKLQRLNLAHNRIDDIAATVIAAAVRHAEFLQEIDLRDNCIGDQGLKALAIAFSVPRDLPMRLYLWGNTFGEDSASAFSELLSTGSLTCDFKVYFVEGRPMVALVGDSDMGAQDETLITGAK